MKCNWLTIITCLIYLHCYFQIYLLFLCWSMYSRLLLGSLFRQGEKCQFCTFRFVSVSFSSRSFSIRWKSFELDNKFTLHDYFSERFFISSEWKSRSRRTCFMKWKSDSNARYYKSNHEKCVENEILTSIDFVWHLIAAWLINEAFIAERSLISEYFVHVYNFSAMS